jgi:hypothetical protein
VFLYLFDKYFLVLQIICQQSDKIAEMAAVMQKVIQVDENNAVHEEELLTRLATENKVSGS